MALTAALAAALLHAAWNFLAKQSGDKQAFFWSALMFALLVYAPLALPDLASARPPGVAWLCIVASGILETAYFITLGRAYATGDLSLVYPLARGSGVLGVAVLAPIFLRERIGLLAVAGIASIVAGIGAAHVLPRGGWRARGAAAGAASRWALATGAVITGYSLVDKVGVGLVSPLAYGYLVFATTAVLFTPYILWTKRDAVRKEWALHRGSILAVGVLQLLTYLLILFAFRLGRVSIVAAARESSVMFGVLLGIVVLREPATPPRLLGSGLILAGLLLLALAR